MKTLILLSLILAIGFSKLVVYHPRTLRNKVDPIAGVIGSSLANFGNIPYGHSIIGNLWYDPDNANGCEDFKIEITGAGDPDAEASPIVLVKRGECPFVKKVRNIEHAGGALAVIIDNKPGEMVENVIMIDDGSGNGINIPSMLISTKDGESIIEEFDDCEAEHQLYCVQLLAGFELPHPDNRAEYDFYYTSTSDQALDFIQNFGEYHKKFQKDVFFTPRFVSWNCPNCETDFKNKHCFSDGKYCAFEYGNSNHTGQEILYENLREKCLHNILQDKGSDDEWWDYMKYAHVNCRTDINEDCSKAAMEKIYSATFAEVNKCVEDSFDGTNHKKDDNSILFSESENFKNNGPHVFPALVINNQTYRGFLNPDHVFEALCNGFKDKPSECAEFRAYGIAGVDGAGVSMLTLVLIVVGILACNIGLLVCYRSYQKKEMQSEIRMTANTAVSQYFAVSNFDKDDGLRRPNV